MLLSRVRAATGQIHTIFKISIFLVSGNSFAFFLSLFVLLPPLIWERKKHVNIKKLLAALRKQGIKKILVEGGGEINWSFVKENLVDEAMITITPYLVGGVTSTTLVDGDGFSTIAKSTKLKLKSTRRMNNEIILHYEN